MNIIFLLFLYNMVIYVCDSLNIPLYIKRIIGLKRDRQNYRDLYEEYTRKIRFMAYK